jgi:mRNA deadenylase 3'-5' endonuclease subunit Ccr4
MTRRKVINCGTLDDCSALNMRLAVATYNVHGCVRWDGQYSRDRILTVLRELQADLIALQEVEGEETLRWFAEHLRMTVISGPMLQRAGGGAGMAC